MKALNRLLGLLLALLVLWFLYVWSFVPEKKQGIQDWWYEMMIDCEQLQQEISNHQRCERSDDCELARREKVRAKKLELQYHEYCSKL